MENDFCLRTSPIWRFVGYGLFVLKIIIPLVIIVLGIIDFSKAVLSGEDKAVKASASSLFKRLIVGICIFFIPTIVSLILSMIESANDALDSIKECETCLLEPLSEECDGYTEDAKSYIEIED